MPSTGTVTDRPVSVLVASRDTAYAQCLAACLEGRSMAASVLDASVAGPAGLGAAALADVLVLETCGLGDPEWSLVHRLLEASPLMEVVEISTDADVGQAVEELRSGVFAVFAYPVSDEDLAAAIVGAAARKRRAEERLRAISGPRARGE